MTLPPGHHARQGEAVQVEPMKPMLKAPGTKRLKLKYDILLSSFAFNFNLRRYTKLDDFDNACSAYEKAIDMAGRCRLTLSNPR